jgi:hypothetical protein
MKNFKKNIQLQQQQPENGTEVKVADDMNNFFTQDILRDRIKAIEKKFSEIKTNFHKNLSSIS